MLLLQEKQLTDVVGGWGRPPRPPKPEPKCCPSISFSLPDLDIQTNTGIANGAYIVNSSMNIVNDQDGVNNNFVGTLVGVAGLHALFGY